MGIEGLGGINFCYYDIGEAACLLAYLFVLLLPAPELLLTLTGVSSLYCEFLVRADERPAEGLVRLF